MSRGVGLGRSWGRGELCVQRGVSTGLGGGFSWCRTLREKCFRAIIIVQVSDCTPYQNHCCLLNREKKKMVIQRGLPEAGGLLGTVLLLYSSQLEASCSSFSESA